VRFPIERRLTNFRDRIFDGNARYPVNERTTDAELDGMAERMALEACGGAGPSPLMYAQIRVGLGKSRDRALAMAEGLRIEDEHFDFGDEELVEAEAYLYAQRQTG
jgi:hypothetical protein